MFREHHPILIVYRPGRTFLHTFSAMYALVVTYTFNIHQTLADTYVTADTFLLINLNST